jgi:hypothetical protein
MKVLLLSSMLLLLQAISCNKDKDTSGLTIVAGSVCGWCGGIDSLFMSENSLNYRYMNPCNECVDGCDQWITIRNGSYSHIIRFGYGDSAALISIYPFADKLDSIREVFRVNTEW